MDPTYFFILPLAALFFGWATWTSRALLSFPLAVASFLPFASVATLVELWTGFDSKSTLLILSTLWVLFVVIFRRESLSLVKVLESGIGALALAALAAGSTYLSKTFGLSSIGFTDGHTILVRAIKFANGEPAVESGVKALKRGFGISAIHAQGNPSEYLVGFMPLIFLAALAASGILVWVISGDRFISFLLVAVIAALGVTIEAIGRHIWLINSHSFLWLAFSLILIFFYESIRDSIPSSFSFAALLMIFSGIGFLRVDAILISLPFVLFSLYQFKGAYLSFNYAVIPTIALSAFLWIISVTEEFPLFGSVGPYLFLAFGLVAGFISGKYGFLQKLASEVLTGNLFWYLAGAILIYSFFAIDYGSSFYALVLNLFLGQGLWGALPYLTFIGLGLTIVFHKRFIRDADRVTIRAMALSILIFLVIKSWDSLDFGVLYGGVVRTGFGDSFNRNLISWTPLLVVLASNALRFMLDRGGPKAMRH